jgi:hypothetical protein
MVIYKTVYYEDGTNRYIGFEKPSGALPTSIVSFRACLVEAEKLGKKVSRVCDTVMFRGVLLDRTSMDRDDIIGK